MANYYLLALGFLLSIISGSLSETTKTSADLTDADLEVFQKHFTSIVELGEFTCANYVDKCGDNNTPSGEICQAIIKMLTCEDQTNLEGIKQVIKTIEGFDPKFVSTSLEKLKVIHNSNKK